MKETGAASAFLPARKLAAFLGWTPTSLFLYDEKSLVQTAQTLFAYFAWEPGFLPLFPVRMNRNPAILRLLCSVGCGAVCQTAEELRLAAVCGFSGSRLRYLPALPDAEAEQLAHTLGAVFVLDDVHVLPERPPERAVLLLRPEGPLRYEGRAVTGVPELISGMDRPSLIRTARRLCSYGTKVLGLGMQTGDLCMDGRLYPAIAQTLASCAAELLQKTGIAAAAIDLGGGFGVSYRPGYPAPDMADCAQALRRIWDTLPEPLRGMQLRMSPGRYLAAASGVLITRAAAVKPMTPPLVLLDVQQAQCLRLAKSGAYHAAHVPLAENRRSLLQQLTACGAVQSGAILRQVLPELRAGDAVVFEMLGADGSSCALAGCTPCAEYLLHTDGTIERV